MNKENLEAEIKDAKWDVDYYTKQIEKMKKELEKAQFWLESLEKKLAELK